VADRTDATLGVSLAEGHVVEELAAALLGGGAAGRQGGSLAGDRKPPEVGRTEEPSASLELRDALEFFRGRLRVAAA
jgi:hypothetical protein